MLRLKLIEKPLDDGGREPETKSDPDEFERPNLLSRQLSHNNLGTQTSTVASGTCGSVSGPHACGGGPGQQPVEPQ